MRFHEVVLRYKNNVVDYCTEMGLCARKYLTPKEVE
jgi:hypothetical protein